MANNRFEELIAKQFEAAAQDNGVKPEETKSDETKEVEASTTNETGVDGSTESTEPVQEQETVQPEGETQEESSLNTENKEETPEVSDTPKQSEEAKTTEPSYEFEDLLIEKSNGKFTTYDEVAEAIDALEKAHKINSQTNRLRI